MKCGIEGDPAMYYPNRQYLAEIEIRIRRSYRVLYLSYFQNAKNEGERSLALANENPPATAGGTERVCRQDVCAPGCYSAMCELGSLQSDWPVEPPNAGVSTP